MKQCCFAVVVLFFALLTLAGCATHQAQPAAVESFDITGGANPFISTYPRMGDGMLAWSCTSGRLSVAVGLTDPVGHASELVIVRYAFGQEDLSKSEPWLISRRSGFPLAYLRPSRVAAFTDKAASNREVHIEASDPQSRQTVAYQFPITGLREALQHLPCAE